MPNRLRQICLVAEPLAPVLDDLALENASVRFVNAIDDRAKRRGVPFTRNTVLICGTRFRLVNA